MCCMAGELVSLAMTFFFQDYGVKRRLLEDTFDSVVSIHLLVLHGSLHSTCPVHRFDVWLLGWALLSFC